TSSGDRYFPGVLTTIIDLFSPNFVTSTKTAVNLGGNDPAAPGDQVQYTLNFVNSGDDPATGAVATDPVPAATTYVPGSLERFAAPVWVPLTDAADGDLGAFDATGGGGGSTSFRLGTLAARGGSAAVRFRVAIDRGAAGTTVTDQASLSYTAA